MDDAHTKPTDEIINYFKTDEVTGLSDEQVTKYQEKYGANGKLTLQYYLIQYYAGLWLCGQDVRLLRSRTEVRSPVRVK